MNWLLILISTFSIPAFAAPSRAQSLVGHIAIQDGPNCFNTSLYLQGFTQDLIYNSQTELDFYLQNFCSQKTANAHLETRDLVAFVDPTQPTQVAHTVVSVQGPLILEKSSLAGAITPAQDSDPQPGQYLKRDISESLYSPRSSQVLFETIFKQKAYRCQDEAQVLKALISVNKNPAIQEQLRLRKELAKAIHISDRKELEQKILETFVPLIAALKWDSYKLASTLETHYLQALLRSNAYQMYLLNCGDSLARTGECYVPQLKKSTEQTEAWFQKIYAFEKKHNLK